MYGKIFTTKKEMLADILWYLRQGKIKIPQDKLESFFLPQFYLKLKLQVHLYLYRAQHEYRDYQPHSCFLFVSFTDRRIAFRGFFEATKVAKEVKLDIVHTQTEFALGTIGKYVAHQLKIPAIHACNY